MDRIWYANLEGQAAGPYTAQDIKQLVAAGHIARETLICRTGGEWIAAGNMKGLFSESPTDFSVRSVASKYRRSSKQSGTLQILGIVGGVFLFVVFLGLLMLNDTEHQPAPATQQSSTPRQTTPAERKWYVGGTLHGATLSEWYAAKYENRLATCADFLTAKDETYAHDLNELKVLAAKLENAISTAGRDAPKTMGVSETCAVIFVLWDQGAEL